MQIRSAMRFENLFLARRSCAYSLLGVLAGLAAPAGLLAYATLFGAPDPRFALAVLIPGGVAVLGFAGWIIGRGEDALAAQNRDLAAASEELRLLAVTDPLTALANRRAFDERLSLEVALAQRYRHGLALVILDLDRFKQTNDRFGHQVGDDVLRAVAAIIGRRPRAGDLIARYGGEEFAAILPHSDARAAVAWSERMRGAIAADISAAGLPPTTASFGVAAFKHGGPTTPDSLVAAADRALYSAKRAGRNQVAVADADLVQPDPAPMAS
jgi:diguanylate cyclase (GGDEF)-like protein